MNLGNLNSNGRSVGLVWIIAGGLAIILGGLLLSTLTPALFPEQGSAEAQQVDNLFRFMLAIGGAIFLLVNGVLLFSVIRFRARKGDNSDGPPIQGNTTLEFVWTVIPAIIVAVITIYSYQVWTTIRAPQPNEMTVNAVGQRFAWSFSVDVPQDGLPTGINLEALPEDIRAKYAAGERISFSSTQLHTWVGQPVHVLLNTQDVNHAFWIPGMRIKQDLLGGRETDIRFTPIAAGPYRIVCAELCGEGHGNMAGTVTTISGEAVLQGAWLIVHPDEETYLREYYNPEALKVLFPPDDPVELGRQLLASGAYPCATCHTLTEFGWTGALAPSLNGIGTRAANRIGGQTAEEYIRNSLRHPGDFLVPGFTNLMPQFTEAVMPEVDLNAITKYLLTQE